MAAALPVAGVARPLSPIVGGDSSAKVPVYSLHPSSIPESGPGSPVLQLSGDGLPKEMDPKVEAGYDSYLQDGGSGDFSSYLEKHYKDFMDTMTEQYAKDDRQRRSLDPAIKDELDLDPAVKDKLELREKEKRRQQIMKITGSSSSSIDEAEKWANFDPTSKILPHSTQRLDALVCPPDHTGSPASVWIRAISHEQGGSVHGQATVDKIVKVFNQVEGVQEPSLKPIVKFYANEDVPNIEDLAASDDSGLEASGDEGPEDRPHRPEDRQVHAQWHGLFTDDLTRELMVLIGTAVSGLVLVQVIRPVGRALQALYRFFVPVRVPEDSDDDDDDDSDLEGVHVDNGGPPGAGGPGGANVRLTPGAARGNVKAPEPQGQGHAGQVPRGGGSQSFRQGRGRSDRQAARNMAAFPIHRDPGVGDLTPGAGGLAIQSSPGQNEPPVLPEVIPRPTSASRARGQRSAAEVRQNVRSALQFLGAQLQGAASLARANTSTNLARQAFTYQRNSGGPRSRLPSSRSSDPGASQMVRSASVQDFFCSPAIRDQGTRPRHPSTSTPITHVQEPANVTRGRVTWASSRRLAAISTPRFAGDGEGEDELDDATEDTDDANATVKACVKPSKKTQSG